jgi:hypothetical protein
MRTASPAITGINENLTPIENQFVGALGDASRMTYRWLQRIMLAVIAGLLLLGTVLSLRILQQRKRTEDRVNHMAFHDKLTSLPNRLMLNQHLDQALSRHRRAGTQQRAGSARRGAFEASALRQNTCAAAIPRSRRSRKSMVLHSSKDRACYPMSLDAPEPS